VRALNLKPGAVVIDLCAGLGTKATQAAECIQNQGLVLAADTDAAKLERLRANGSRLGLTCVETVLVDELDKRTPELPRIDAILIDVPCSNTGVLARRPEARYRFSEPGLAELSRIQGDLLKKAVQLARRETVLCYSTCSIEPEENARLVDEFCEVLPAWRILRQQQQLPVSARTPEEWRDGGYFAVLAR
jgi:16S rRNA (cytosine967-C5)-methyltransferase